MSNLACLSQYVIESLDNNLQVDVIYTDLSKAFDLINHDLLLVKLLRLGFSVELANLLTSYLRNRCHFVEFNGYRSNTYTNGNGVPQGSNLGPLLFLLYINDLAEELSCNRLLFADDVTIFSAITTADDCITLQNQLCLLHKWCTSKGLKLNVAKCKMVGFSRRLSPVRFQYSISGELINRDVVKDLGVHFDTNSIQFAC